jgi:hypothetical protein
VGEDLIRALARDDAAVQATAAIVTGLVTAHLVWRAWHIGRPERTLRGLGIPSTDAVLTGRLIRLFDGMLTDYLGTDPGLVGPGGYPPPDWQQRRVERFLEAHPQDIAELVGICRSEYHWQGLVRWTTAAGVYSCVSAGLAPRVSHRQLKVREKGMAALARFM